MLKFLKLFLLLGICWAAPQQGQHGARTTAATPTEADVYFTVSATNLHGEETDNDGEVDPFVKVYYGVESITNFTEEQTTLERIGTSETLENDNNPTWNTVFKVKYTRGTNQVIHLVVRDHDPFNPDDALGDAVIRMDDFITRAAYHTHLMNSKSGGITVTQTTPIYLDLTLKDLPAKDNWGGASDPYINCYFRTDSEGHNYLFHRTDTIDNAETASFTHIPFENYRRGTNQVLHFEVFDHDTFSADDSLGTADLAVDSFIASKRASVLSLGGGATLMVSLNRDL